VYHGSKLPNVGRETKGVIRTMKKLLSSAALLLVVAAPAAAADLRMPVKAAPAVVVAAYNWTGFYIGAHCGWAQTNTKTSNHADGGFDDGDLLTYSNNANGATCGGQLGYNWQTSNIVLGVESDIAWVGIDRELRNLGVSQDDMVKVEYSWLATFTGRFGFAFDRALVYAKGGAALARIKNTATDLDGGGIDPTDISEVSKSRWGWTVGGGLEYGFTPNWSMKGEYMFANFGSYTSPLNLDGDSYTHKNQLHTVKFGINYRWGAAPVVARY
jgi:outer membrane immunogenic protein